MHKATTIVHVKHSPLASAEELTGPAKVSQYLSRILPVTRGGSDPLVAALVPWVCDRLPSPHSRRAYATDLAAFLSHMRERGIMPLDVRGDDLRVYKAALREAGASSTSIARTLSVLRGAYQQFGARGLLSWERVRDIQSVESPRVEKNSTPSLSQSEAIRLLHTPDRTTHKGMRDHLLLFLYFKTACRCSALANALVGDIERTDTDYYLVVREKGGKSQRKAILEAAPVLQEYLDRAGLRDDPSGPLFRPLDRTRRGFLPRPLPRWAVWHIVRTHAAKAGIDVERAGRRGVCVHSLRKTAITNALENGAKIEQVQQLAGHADIRTTQMYYRPSEKDAENAARHIQIR